MEIGMHNYLMHKVASAYGMRKEADQYSTYDDIYEDQLKGMEEASIAKVRENRAKRNAHVKPTYQEKARAKMKSQYDDIKRLSQEVSDNRVALDKYRTGYNNVRNRLDDATRRIGGLTDDVAKLGRKNKRLALLGAGAAGLAGIAGLGGGALLGRRGADARTAAAVQEALAAQEAAYANRPKGLLESLNPSLLGGGGGALLGGLAGAAIGGENKLRNAAIGAALGARQKLPSIC